MMKVIKFLTWMEPEQAVIVLDFLADLQDVLYERYSKEIQKMNEKSPPNDTRTKQPKEDEEGEWFDDDIPF